MMCDVVYSDKYAYNIEGTIHVICITQLFCLKNTNELVPSFIYVINFSQCQGSQH